MDSSNFSKRLLKDDTKGAQTISLGNEFHAKSTALSRELKLKQIR